MAIKKKPAMFTGFYGWGWTQLTELCEMVGVTPTQLFKNFAPLSKDADQSVLSIEMMGKFYNLSFTNLENLEKDTLDVAKKHEVNTEDIISSVFVPAGWAMDVLKAHEEGYTAFSLSCEYIDEGDQIPENWWVISHNTGFNNQYYVAVGQKKVQE